MFIPSKIFFASLLLSAALAGCGGSSTIDSPSAAGSVVDSVPVATGDPSGTGVSRQSAFANLNLIGQSTPATQVRVVHFDLDPVFSDSDDAAQVLSNIGQMANRVRALYRPGMDLVIYLSAFSNATATQKAYDKLFFPSVHLGERGGNLRFNDAELPKGELFARAARAIKQAAPGVKVYAWMPMMNYKLDPKSPSYQDSLTSYIQSDLPSEQNDTTQYKRLSPFVGIVWDVVAQIYSDLGSSAGKYIDGIVFHDDGIMTDHEDSSATAQAFLQSYDWSTLVPGDTRGWDQLTAKDRAIRKARYLDQYSLYMVEETQWAMHDKFGIDKKLGTARHVYSSAFTNPDSVQWLSQEPASMLQDYDYVLIEAYPYMEERGDVQKAEASANFCELKSVAGCVAFPVAPYYDALYSAVARQAHGREKVVFVMQTVDWNTGTGAVTDLSSDMIGNQMRALYQKGAVHFGWYPDRYFSSDAHPTIAGDFKNMLVLRH